GRVKSTIASLSRRGFPGPVGWLFGKCATPIMSAHLGTDVRKFKPMKMVSKIWPGAVLVVHGRGESFARPADAMDLFRKASAPRQQYWPNDNLEQQRSRTINSQMDFLREILREGAGDDQMDSDPGALRQTIEFMRAARKAL